MKNIKEILIFYLKTALFIAITGITMGAFVLGGFYYSINKTNTHTQYYDDLYQVSVIYPDSIINALMNNEKTDYEIRVISTAKNDFSQDKIKVIELTNHGDSHINIYFKGRDNSFRWLFAKNLTVGDTTVKYFTRYSSATSSDYTHAQFEYNDRYYKITVESGAEEALIFITDTIKAMD